jgi:hypothetical protein
MFCIHCRSAVDASSSRRIDGSATETTVESSIRMNIPADAPPSTHQRRFSSVIAGTGRSSRSATARACQTTSVGQHAPR